MTWRERGGSTRAGCGGWRWRVRCRRAAWRRLLGEGEERRATLKDIMQGSGRRGSFDDHVSRVPGRAKVAHDGNAAHGDPLQLAVADVDGCSSTKWLSCWFSRDGWKVACDSRWFCSLKGLMAPDAAPEWPTLPLTEPMRRGLLGW